MKITFKADPKDPVYPIMHGNGATAKEFNKRQSKLWKDQKFDKFDFEQVVTVLLEIFGDDYDERHKKTKK